MGVVVNIVVGAVTIVVGTAVVGTGVVVVVEVEVVSVVVDVDVVVLEVVDGVVIGSGTVSSVDDGDVGGSDDTDGSSFDARIITVC